MIFACYTKIVSTKIVFSYREQHEHKRYSETCKYVTVFGETDEPEGWRPGKVDGGCLIDIDSGETIARGFSMPHSPRVYAGKIWVLDSGKGQLVTVDEKTGDRGREVGIREAVGRPAEDRQELTVAGDRCRCVVGPELGHSDESRGARHDADDRRPRSEPGPEREQRDNTDLLHERPPALSLP